jgi:predicted permease
MFTVGIYLAQTDLGRMVKRKSLYLVSFVRLLLVPFIGILILALVPASLGDMKSALLLALACPVGSNVAVYAQLHGKDYPYAVETVVISTMLSLLTIPAVVRLASAVW